MTLLHKAVAGHCCQQPSRSDCPLEDSAVNKEIDKIINCVAYITLVAGPPGGPEVHKEDSSRRRWVWYDEDDTEDPVICLVLLENDCRVELDLEIADTPRYFAIIGWCAMNSVPCYITLGGHWMRVVVETVADESMHRAH